MKCDFDFEELHLIHTSIDLSIERMKNEIPDLSVKLLNELETLKEKLEAYKKIALDEKAK